MEINGSVAKNFESTKIAKSGPMARRFRLRRHVEWLFP